MPGSALTVRSDDDLTPLADAVRLESGRTIDLSAPRLILLIHGFQNSHDQAHQSFDRFVAALTASAWPSTLDSYAIWEFHWPGDHPNKLASLTTYPTRVPDAVRAGEKLAQFLNELNRTQQVSIVAHSLGCRVALEALREITRLRWNYTGPTLLHIFLLAAAVPAPQCKSGQRLDETISGRYQYAYHSTRDAVLRTSFRPGEYLYGEPGEAVGRHGAPDGRWTDRIDTGLGHGKYWKSDIVADDIARRLGVAGTHAPTERSVSTSEVAAATPLAERVIRQYSPSRRPPMKIRRRTDRRDRG